MTNSCDVAIILPLYTGSRRRMNAIKLKICYKPNKLPWGGRGRTFESLCWKPSLSNLDDRVADDEELEEIGDIDARSDQIRELLAKVVKNRRKVTLEPNADRNHRALQQAFQAIENGTFQKN